MITKIIKIKVMKIKANKIIKARVTSAKTKTIKIKRRVNSKIRIFTIIFIIKKFYKRRASTRERRMNIIKSLVNIFFVKRLYNIRAYEKTFFDLLKCEQCDLNYIVT